MKKIILLLFVALLTISFIHAQTVTTQGVWNSVRKGFIDTFDRPNNVDVGENWTEVLEAVDADINISGNKLNMTDRSTVAQAKLEINVANNSNGNLQRAFSMSYLVENFDSYLGVNTMRLKLIATPNQNRDIHEFRFNGSGFILSTAVIDGANSQNYSTGVYQNLTIIFNWSTNISRIFLNGINFANASTEQTFSTPFISGIIFDTGTSAQVGNISLDYLQFGDEYIQAENSQTFNATALEGSLETFIINITTDGSQLSSGTLIYNDTLFPGVLSKNGNEYIISRELFIPNFPSTTIVNFSWLIVPAGAGGTTNFSSTSQTQTVSVLTLDACTTNTILLLNYSLIDEATEVVLNNSLHNSTVEVEISLRATGSSTSFINFSQNYSANNNPQVCLNLDLGNSSFELYVQTTYDADFYSAETHNIRNATLTNSSLPQNIDLHDLLDADTTEFLIEFKDKNFLPVKDAIINIQRKYVSQGVFKSVESPLTDASGRAVAHLDVDNVIYTITVTKDRETLGIFDNIAVICQDTIIGDCEINLKALTSIVDLNDLTSNGNISYVFSFDEPNRIITLTFTTTDGLIRTVLLNSTKFDRFGNQTVCSDTLTSSAGTLTCNIPTSFGNSTVISRLFVNDALITTRTFTISPNADAEFGAGNTGALILLLMLTVPLMLITSGIGLLIGIIFGLVMATMLMLFDSSSILGSGSAVVWGIIMISIVIYKLMRRESG